MILSCVIGTFVVVGMISVPLVQGWAAKGDLVAVKSEKKMSKPTSITLGKAEIISLPGEVADVMVADSDVVSVEAVQSSKLYVVGQKVGDTNIIALDSNGDVLKKIDIHVTYDLRAIQSMVDDLFPDEQVKIRAIHDQVVLTGTASTPEKASKIADLVTSYVSDLQDMTGEIDEVVSNMLEVRGDQQVTLQVKIIEANRNFVKELGIQTDANDLDELSPTTVFGQSPAVDLDQSASAVLRSGGGVAVANDPAASFRILRDSGIAGIGTLGLFISALEQEDFLSILAEPNLTAISGQQAGFLAGGEFPFPVGRDQVGNLVIDYREFGVSLNFRPVVMSPDRISLQLNTEVSSLDFTNAVPAGDIVVPGLDVRRAETTVEIPSGGSLMIAGLLQSEALEGMSGLPGIKDTPILGDLISSNSFERNETELVIIITAYVAEPFAAEDKAKKVPKQENKPLAKAFANNMRKSFKRVDDAVFDADESYGYILD
jgi:pilus assembly protein CpaC